MSVFENLRQANYHKVAVGPFEQPTHTLIGSDTVLHLPVLEYFASLCDTCVEFGVRTGESTTALIAGCPGKVISYDIQNSSIVAVLNEMELPCQWEFRQGNTGGELDFDECDLLFIDTLHTYVHIKKELIYHGRKAQKYLAFHDTFTCGEFDLSGPNPRARGIMPAIQEFLAEYPEEYRVVYQTERNNGFLVIERLPAVD